MRKEKNSSPEDNSDFSFPDPFTHKPSSIPKPLQDNADYGFATPARESLFIDDEEQNKGLFSSLGKKAKKDKNPLPPTSPIKLVPYSPTPAHQLPFDHRPLNNPVIAVTRGATQPDKDLSSDIHSKGDNRPLPDIKDATSMGQAAAAMKQREIKSRGWLSTWIKSWF